MARREIKREFHNTEVSPGDVRQWVLVTYIETVDDILVFSWEISYKGYTTSILIDENTTNQNAITFIEMVDANLMG